MGIIDKILCARGCYFFHCLVKLVIMKLRICSPDESRRRTINFRVERSKSVGINFLVENCFKTIIEYSTNSINDHETSYTCSLLVKNVLY